MRILTAEEMREVDRDAIERVGIPGPVLMENAAIGVVDAIGEVFPEAESAVIFCGPGNNGGDGLAIARHLEARGYEVEVVLATGGREMRGDAGLQLAICRELELPILELEADEDPAEVVAAAAGMDLVIDALYGTGLARPLKGQAAALVEAINELPVPRVAVDVPSGLHGSRAGLYGPHVRADLTVTFAAPKVAHVFPPAAEATGELVVADLGIPARLVDGAPGGLHLLVAAELAPLLPPLARDAHKGDRGHALIVAGSPGKAGAAILAARAAVRSGAGLVTVAVPEPLLATVDGGSIESMTLALPAGPEGQIAGEAVERALAAAEGKRALALGPGLGQEPATAEAIRRLLLASEIPLVIDADGLNAFAGRARELAGRKAPAILTPHPGELGRLLGLSAGEVQADRLAAARMGAEETRAIVILKGHLTLIATPEGEIYVTPNGNPGMGTGGTGDVLTGLLAGLLAQGLDPVDAARLGAFLHGAAGDLAAGRAGERGIAAGDLVDQLPRALADLAAG